MARDQALTNADSELMPDPFDVFLSSPAIMGSTVFLGNGDQRCTRSMRRLER
ncbi:MAG: hypothetical protein ACR2HZ_10000 [Gemmatimonadaceae bacterium]